MEGKLYSLTLGGLVDVEKRSKTVYHKKSDEVVVAKKSL